MGYVRRAALPLVAGALLAGAAPHAGAEPPARGPGIVGTYQLLAKDMVQPNGTLRDVYTDFLVTGDRAYRLRLPKGTHLRGGEPVRVRGTLAGQDLTVVSADNVEVLGERTTMAATGTTKVLVILVHWSAPDSMTLAKAKSQVFGDDNGWFKEASYGQLALSGDATGWHKIAPPEGGQCMAGHLDIMTKAKAKALAAGYNAANYHRTMVYFPRCGGDAAGAAGWAYQPGKDVWMNGYFDRRVSVHEQGHNYGLPHAHTYHCTKNGVPVTMGGTCSYDEYGDDYDAMGSSQYAAHFSAPAKDQLGWLAGRKRSLGETASSTFTLPPFEKAGSLPLTAIAGTSDPTRTYWIEYRQRIGYDSALPSGATGGVLVHLRDKDLPGGDAAFLLDPSPHTAFADAVIPPGGAWTSPEGVRVSVGTVATTGAQVTVLGSAPPATVPSAPRAVTATGGDESVRLTWTPPSSNGGATVQEYVVSGSPGGISETVAGTAVTIPGLTNGTAYTFTVKARNAVGLSTASAAVSATPAPQLPSVAITAPADGATVGGDVLIAATATKNLVSNAAIEGVSFEVDGESIGWDPTAPYTATWDSTWIGDGEHTITATAYDTSYRYQASAPVTVTVATPKPSVTVTAPANNATVTADTVTLQASATTAGSPIDYVVYELTDGTFLGYATTAPYAAEWDVTLLNGPYDVVAKAYDTAGRYGTSPPVHVTFDHPVPSVTLTAPADGASVQGSEVAVTADAAAGQAGTATLDHVEFYVDGVTPIGWDWEAPFETVWDTGTLMGEHEVSAVAYDSAGRSATSVHTVDVDNPLPSVTLTTPADYAVVDGLVTFAATATPNADSGSPLANVTFTVDGWNVAADVAAPGPYTTTWDPGTAYGQHTVVATAYDAAGKAGVSQTITFSVPYPKPTAVLTSPADGATLAAGTVPLALDAEAHPGTQSPVTTAYFYVDGWYVGDDSTPGDGFTAPWDATPGSHVVTAEVYAEDGNYGTAPPVAVTVADVPGTPWDVTATAGLDGTATVSWEAPGYDGGSAVTGYVVRTSTGAEHAASSSPFTVTGLANGTTYTFRVKAVNVIGAGPLSTASNAAVPGTRTSLSIALNTSKVVYGKPVTVTGYLRRTDTGAVLPGRSVQLLACTPGTLTCSVVKTGTTASTGKVSLAYVPKLHRDLRLRYLRTTDAFLSVTTGAKRVYVKALVTSAISKTSMLLGSTATVSGKVSPAHSGKRVYLQRYTSTGWKSVAYKTLGTTGTASFSVKPTSRGTWRYRLYFGGDADHLANWSPTRSVTVS